MKQFLSYYILTVMLLFFLPKSLLAETYPEVLFENSTLSHSYFYSEVSYRGNSWVKNIKKNLPVSDSIYFTPNNALSLNYISSVDGHWQADVKYPESYLVVGNSILIFKLFIQSNTSIEELPAIQLIQSGFSTDTIQIKDFVSNVQKNKWVSIEIPLNKIKGLAENTAISAIRFFQQSNDGKEHKLYLDQIEILPLKIPRIKLTSAAYIQTIIPFERHVDIYWRLPLTPSIRYIKIYRSENNKDFKPVAIRPIFATKFSDIIPEVGKLYYYRVAWVDYQYNESPVSKTKEVKTTMLNNTELLNMIQRANIQFFIDGAEYNSGMQQHKLSGKDAIVSLKLSGLGILTLISGVEQKMYSREVLIAQIKKIVDFLGKAESFHGAFPSFMDGRTGKGVFKEPQKRTVSLQGTSYLIQGLLVARQYLNHDNVVEREIRERILKLWRAVEWDFFIKPESSFLFTNWSPDTQFENAIPLLGRDALSTYLIALASPSHNIELESYRQALTSSYKIGAASNVNLYNTNYLEADSIAIPEIANSKLLDQLVENESDTPTWKGYFYGIPLMGNSERSLINSLGAFLVFDPRNKHDEFTNYFVELQNLISIQYRKSLENSVLPVSLADGLLIDSKGWVVPSASVASFPFQPEFSIHSLVSVYRKYPALFWSEYGFRTVHLGRNQIRSNSEGIYRAISAIMIENGKSNLIWNLFSQDQDINKVVNALFKSEKERN